MPVIHLLSAMASRSFVVVKSADSTTLVFFSSAILNNVLASGCGCCEALSAKDKLLFEAIMLANDVANYGAQVCVAVSGGLRTET